MSGGATWTAHTTLPLPHLFNDTLNWCLGRPGQIQQTNTRNIPSSMSVTRTTEIFWNGPFCRPTETVDEPNSSMEVTTVIGYDDFGNVETTTVTGKKPDGSNMEARTNTTSYGDASTTGQFPLSVTNALEQTSHIGWNYTLGLPTSRTDLNGLYTTWNYDAFGRRNFEGHPDGTYTSWELTYCAPGAGCDPKARMVVGEIQLTSTGAVFDRYYAYTDQFDRPILELRSDSGSTYNTVYRFFDALGRVSHESLPYKAALGDVIYVSTTFDLLNRPITISRPVSDASPAPIQTTTISYEGLTTKVTDALSKHRWMVKNAAGLLAQTKDQEGYSQNFQYDPFGNPTGVVDSLGNTLQNSVYNGRGALTQRTDMEMGAWSFIPNSLGETVSQTDANGNETTFV